jgi:hypothetical protein
MDTPATPDSFASQDDISQGFDQKLDRLADQWQSLEDGNLEVRHATGTLLNDRLDAPTKRQPRGAEVTKKVAERLQIPKSEISRLRWFVHFFPSVQDLKERYPEAKKWSHVKDLIPTLKPKKETQDDGAKPGKAAKGSPSKLRKVKQLQSRLSQSISEVQNDLSDTEKAVLLREFSDFARETSNRISQLVRCNGVSEV